MAGATRHERDYHAFEDLNNANGDWARRVKIFSSQVPSDYDNGTVTYSTSTQEIYSFYQGATLLKTLTINYLDATKENLISWSFT